MANVDIDNEFLELFYNITGSSIPAEITLESLKKQLLVIVNKFDELNKKLPNSNFNKYSEDAIDDENVSDAPAILIVDDLGVITYQLKVLLSQFNLEVDCSNEMYDAVNKYKKRKHLYVVMDLFIPTEREGFILLTELKKLATMYSQNIIIGVITASPRKEIEQQCKARGADFFLEKNNDWQNQLINIMNGYINDGKVDEEDW